MCVSLQLRTGAQQYALKDKHCLAGSRGVVHIETELVYNPVRAMIRTVNPREVKMLEAEQKFKRKVMKCDYNCDGLLHDAIFVGIDGQYQASFQSGPHNPVHCRVH